MNTFTEIIEYAIDREIEAETFYLQVAGRATRADVRELFTGFAAEEKKHQQMLRAILAKKQTQPHFATTTDYGIAETVAAPPVASEMGIADIFAVAMNNEAAAMRMYQQLAADSTIDENRQLFTALAAMEQGHKAKMEQSYTDVAFGEVW